MNPVMLAIALGAALGLGMLTGQLIKQWWDHLPWCNVCREHRVLPTFDYCLACQLELH